MSNIDFRAHGFVNLNHVMTDLYIGKVKREKLPADILAAVAPILVSNAPAAPVPAAPVPAPSPAPAPAAAPAPAPAEPAPAPAPAEAEVEEVMVELPPQKTRVPDLIAWAEAEERTAAEVQALYDREIASTKPRKSLIDAIT